MTTDLDQDPQPRRQMTPAERVRQAEVQDIKWLMSHKQGRRFMARLLAQTHLYRTSFTGNSETFFREGERNVGLFLLDEVTTHAHDGYIAMLTEAKDTSK